MLAPVAPNPSRGAADVRFTLPQASDVQLGIYDIAGRRVRNLVAGAFAAGTHAARWDGHDASGARVRPGVYFVRLQAGGGTLVRTLVLTN
jgi:flagellar hook assembly protein FlgD